MSRLRRFLAELRRRKVLRVAAAYVAAAFAGLEGLDLLMPLTNLPDWTPRLFFALVVVGFPVVLVIAWAFEITPEGLRRTPPLAPGEEAPAQGGLIWLGPAVLAALLIGGAVWWYARPDPLPIVDPSGRRVVAVLPFTTAGAGVEDLGEGMVNLLSIALDGAGGVRAIDQRTVLSRWDREAAAEGGEPDLQTALAVARGLGAEWAVTGSVVAAGEDARFVARLVRPEDGKLVGEAQEEGPQDSLLSTIDDLTRQILALLFERGLEEVPPISMASLTTRSVPALKAFLSGELYYRHGRMDSAVAAYERAVDEDSTFALAHLRRGVNYAWANWVGPQQEGLSSSLEKAYRYREDLPERARLMVVGAYLHTRADYRAGDTLELATRRYPDDAGLWFWLGEVYFHKRGCYGPEEADRALSRAVELDPGFAPYWIHLIHLAIGFYRDSALAASRVEAMSRAESRGSPSSEPSDANQDPFIRLVFGPGPAAERVEAFLGPPGTDVPLGRLAQLGVNTAHPSLWALRDTFLRVMERRGPIQSLDPSGAHIGNSLRAGRIRRALETQEEAEASATVRLYELALARSIGMPLSDSLIRRSLEDVQDTETRGFFDLIGRSVAALELEAPDLAPPVDEVLDRMGAERGLDSASTAPVRRAIEGYRAWKSGDAETALELLGRGTPDWLPAGVLWVADLHRSLGQLEEAAACYRTAFEHPVAHRRLGDVLAEMGRTEEAVEAYLTFLQVWEGADPELQPEVEAVRARVVELTRTPTEAAPDRTRPAEADSGDGG